MDSDKVLSEIKRDCKKLGIYKIEFLKAYKMTADLIVQYETAKEQFKESGYQTVVVSGDKFQKNPIINVLESLRKDILNYLNAIGLTASSFKKFDELQTDSDDSTLVTNLAKLLNKYDGKK